MPGKFPQLQVFSREQTPGDRLFESKEVKERRKKEEADKARARERKEVFERGNISEVRRRAIVLQGELNLLTQIAEAVGCPIDNIFRLGSESSLLEDINEVRNKIFPEDRGVIEDSIRRFGLLREDLVRTLVRYLESRDDLSQSVKETIIGCSERGNVDVEDNIRCLRGVLKTLEPKIEEKPAA